jgi:hypothetical protein
MQYLFLQGAKYRRKYTVSCKKYGRGYVSASRCAKSQDMTMRKGCARAIAHSQLHMSAPSRRCSAHLQINAPHCTRTLWMTQVAGLPITVSRLGTAACGQDAQRTFRRHSDHFFALCDSFNLNLPVTTAARHNIKRTLSFPRGCFANCSAACRILQPRQNQGPASIIPHRNTFYCIASAST